MQRERAGQRFGAGEHHGQPIFFDQPLRQCQQTQRCGWLWRVQPDHLPVGAQGFGGFALLGLRSAGGKVVKPAAKRGDHDVGALEEKAVWELQRGRTGMWWRARQLSLEEVAFSLSRSLWIGAMK